MRPMEHRAATKIPARVQMPAQMVFVLEGQTRAAPAPVPVIEQVNDALPIQHAALTAAVSNRET
jgi:hypothetical protein